MREYDLSPNNFKREELFIDLVNKYALLELSEKEFYSYYPEAFDLFNSNKGDQMIEKAKKNRKYAAQQRPKQCIYISGKSGSGKSTLAKYILKHLHYDYCDSAASANMFDEYDCQEGLILNDFNGQLEFKSALKLFDNFNSCNIGARYHNKNLDNCRIIIVTNCSPLNELYKNYLDNNTSEEPRWQLYRRFDNGHFYHISNDGNKIAYMAVDKDGNVSLVKYLDLTMDVVFKEMISEQETTDELENILHAHTPSLTSQPIIDPADEDIITNYDCSSGVDVF